MTHELVAWADIIFVMEKTHRAKLQQKFKTSLKKARVICLDIPDDYAFMDPALVDLLEPRVSKYLGEGYMAEHSQPRFENCLDRSLRFAGSSLVLVAVFGAIFFAGLSGTGRLDLAFVA